MTELVVSSQEKVNNLKAEIKQLKRKIADPKASHEVQEFSKAPSRKKSVPDIAKALSKLEELPIPAEFQDDMHQDEDGQISHSTRTSFSSNYRPTSPEHRASRSSRTFARPEPIDQEHHFTAPGRSNRTPQSNKNNLNANARRLKMRSADTLSTKHQSRFTNKSDSMRSFYIVSSNMTHISNLHLFIGEV